MLQDMLIEAQAPAGPGMGPSTVTVDSVAVQQMQALAQQRAEELQESGESTCVALIIMMMTNMRMVLRDHFKQKGYSGKAGKSSQFKQERSMNRSANTSAGP